jgi:ferredoxin
MRIVVDLDSCEGNALCVKAAPEIFRVNEADYVELATDTPSAEQLAAVREAVRRCPRGALRLEPTA